MSGSTVPLTGLKVLDRTFLFEKLHFRLILSLKGPVKLPDQSADCAAEQLGAKTEPLQYLQRENYVYHHFPKLYIHMFFPSVLI